MNIKKALIISYSYENRLIDFIPLFQKLNKKSVFAIEQEPNFALDTQIERHHILMEQLEKATQQTFNLTFNDLINNNNDTLDSDTSKNAFKSLANRAKKLVAQTSILEVLRDNKITDFYGVGNPADGDHALENIKENSMEYTVLLVAKTNLSALEKALKSSKKSVIQTVSMDSVEWPQLVTSGFQKLLHELDNLARFKTSVKAAEKMNDSSTKTLKKVSNDSLSDTLNQPSFDSTSKKMKDLLGISEKNHFSTTIFGNMSSD